MGEPLVERKACFGHFFLKSGDVDGLEWSFFPEKSKSFVHE
jgi:hypothetical protein